jgi:hypothetical protein
MQSVVIRGPPWPRDAEARFRGRDRGGDGQRAAAGVKETAQHSTEQQAEELESRAQDSVQQVRDGD